MPTPAASDQEHAPKRQRTAKKNTSEFDYTQPSGGYPWAKASTGLDIVVCSPDGAAVSEVAGTPGPAHAWSDDSTGRHRITLPGRSGALALVDLYLDTSVYTRSLFHRASTLRHVEQLYDSVARGEGVVDVGTLALVLALCAACSSWKKTSVGSSALLASGGIALGSSGSTASVEAKWSGDWVREAWDVLARCDESPTVQGLQARMVLNDMMYDVEGFTASMRTLVSASIAMAREMGLHLVDHPTRGAASRRADDEATREVKRRLWWYLVGTDWCMSCMGGTFDRVYTIHPRHMAVRKPLNIDEAALDAMAAMGPPGSSSSDSDSSEGNKAREASLPPPTTRHTPVSHLLMRVRAAEICREIVDAMPLEAGDVDELPFDQVARLDGLFEQSLAELPRSVLPSAGPDGRVNGPVRPYAVQINVLHVSLHARRARFLCVFLASRVPEADPRFLIFRRQCFDSAQAAVAMSTDILRVMLGASANNHPPATAAAADSPASSASSVAFTPESLTAHFGVVLAHFFQSCVLTCSDPQLSEPAGPVAGPSLQRRRVLEDAFDVLSRVGRESSWGGRLLQRLAAIMQRFKVNEPEAAPAAAQVPVPVGQVYQPQQQQQSEMGVAGSVMAAAPQPAPPQWQGETTAFQPWGDAYAQGQGPSMFGDFSWQDFAGAVPGGDDWVQLFTDLDGCAGVI